MWNADYKKQSLAGETGGYRTSMYMEIDNPEDQAVIFTCDQFSDKVFPKTGCSNEEEKMSMFYGYFIYTANWQ